MNARISLALAIHNHQPVGNFGWVLAEVFDQAYLPMVEALERHPTVRLSLHYSGPLLEWLHILSRSDVTTRNRRKADELEFAYDDLEERIATLAAEEELAAIRPDLDGEDIMRILGLSPGREVGEAYRFLLEERLEDGPLGPDEAERRLLEWWSARGRG